MASKHREQTIMDTVECPRCHARRGAPCFMHGKPHYGTHGAFIHAERRQAWVESKPTCSRCGIRHSGQCPPPPKVTP